MLEVEIRSIITNKEEIISRLIENNFKQDEPFEQHDIILDTPKADFFNNKQKIRLRIEKGKAEITYKGKTDFGQNVSKRKEINIPVQTSSVDDIVDFFTSIGYPICFQIKKTREIFCKDGITVSLDQWPIIGCMMEIEGEENKITQLAKKVVPEYDFKNYRLRDLFEFEQKRKNMSLTELKEEHYKNTEFDIGNIELILK